MSYSVFLNYGQIGEGGISFHTTGNGTAPLASSTQYSPGWHSQYFRLPIGYWLICVNLYMDVSVATTWIFGIGTAS